jgi:hypothetical protein
LGDLNGALLGAYLMKATLDFFEKKGRKFWALSQTSFYLLSTVWAAVIFKPCAMVG